MIENIQKYYTAYTTAYDLEKEKTYTIPKIYSAKGDLKKRWYVYYSYRNPNTGQMERQTPLTMSINRRFKTVKGRMEQLKLLQKATLQALKDGFSPYDIKASKETIYHPIKDVLKTILSDKEKTLKSTSFIDYRSRINTFIKFLEEKGLEKLDVKKVDKTIVLQYLDEVLTKTTARNRNNHKTVLSSVFSDLCEKGYLENNFIINIKNLKTQSKRDKTINSEDLNIIMEYIEKEDYLMYLYLCFISYFFLRPIEVCRLKVSDINLTDRVLSVEIKQKEYKTKIIPGLIIEGLKRYIGNSSKNCYLFTADGVCISDTDLNNKRNYFSKRFKKLRDKLNLSEKYTVYSFRHTYITKVYKELRKEFNQEESLSKLRLITGHTSEAIHKYIHYIDAELPADYSDLLK